MKRAAAIALLATAFTAQAESEITTITVPVVKCSAPTLSVAILGVTCTAASCQKNTDASPHAGFMALAAVMSGQGGAPNLGGGMKSMLSNALKETGCFKLVDMEQVKKVKEMLEASGQTVTPPKIDLMISGEITTVELVKSGGALAGGIIPVVGLFSRNKEEATIQMDISVMNPSTMEVGASQAFAAKSDKVSWGFGAVAGFAGGGWSISKSLALDAVARDTVVNAANFVVDSYAKDKIVSRPNKEGKQEPVGAAAAAAPTASPAQATPATE